MDHKLSVKSGFHYTSNTTTTTQKQSDEKVEQSSLMLIALFSLEIGRCRGRNWFNGNQAQSLYCRNPLLFVAEGLGHSLIKVTGREGGGGGLTLRFLSRAVQQLKMPPRVDTKSHFWDARAGTIPQFDSPREDK